MQSPAVEVFLTQYPEKFIEFFDTLPMTGEAPAAIDAVRAFFKDRQPKQKIDFLLQLIDPQYQYPDQVVNRRKHKVLSILSQLQRSARDIDSSRELENMILQFLGQLNETMIPISIKK